MNFLASLQENPIGSWVLTSDYGYYICLVGHAIGMAVIVGAVFMLCLKVMGFSKEQPLLAFEPLMSVAWAGFGLNAATGLALFMANAPNLARDPPFLIKIGFIATGGLCLWMLWRRLQEEGLAVAGSDAALVSAGTRTLAALTLGCWLVAIMAGRLIAYTIDY